MHKKQEIEDIGNTIWKRFGHAVDCAMLKTPKGYMTRTRDIMPKTNNVKTSDARYTRKPIRLLSHASSVGDRHKLVEKMFGFVPKNVRGYISAAREAQYGEAAFHSNLIVGNFLLNSKSACGENSIIDAIFARKMKLTTAKNFVFITSTITKILCVMDVNGHSSRCAANVMRKQISTVGIGSID
jgi:hypothetical protein